MLNMNESSNSSSFLPLIEKGISPFAVKLLEKHHPLRCKVEQFILHGYKKAFGADFSNFMPLLLTIKSGKMQAALGMRTVENPLLIEQYLDFPIEQVISSRDVKREQVIEIGNLHSNSKPLTIQLFLLTAVALYMNGYKVLAFTGTEQVLGILTATGISPEIICTAQVESLKANEDNWGSYYSANPTVVSVDLQQVMTVISHTNKYQSLFEKLTTEIAELSGVLSSALLNNKVA